MHLIGQLDPVLSYSHCNESPPTDAGEISSCILIFRDLTLKLQSLGYFGKSLKENEETV